MSLKHLIFHIILLLLISTFSLAKSTVNSTCPIDFTYVETFPWDIQQCQVDTDPKACCETIKSLLGLGLAKYLKNTSNFYLPTQELANTCFSNFQRELTKLSITVPLTQSCTISSNELLNEPTSCAGIKTTRDWAKKAGPTTLLDSSCKGDMGLAQCSSCLDAGMKVDSQLVSLAPNNSTKCFYFTIIYVAGLVNEFGPEDPRSACILGLPLAASYHKKNSPRVLNKGVIFKFVFGFFGLFIAILVSIVLLILFRSCYKRRKEKAVHDKFISSVRGQVLPIVGTKWYLESDIERATDGFSSEMFIAKGGNGVVYKGSFGNEIFAVKQITEDLDVVRDEEFCNEVEIISRIRHRNLLPLRGCCVASDFVRGKRRYLVYDYMPNGSLSDNLCSSNKLKLSWPQRKNIILDVAKGLAYLHYGVKPAIYHRDIKTTNILLDSDMKARVADFGLARESTEGQSHLTTRVAGTYGYLAPEYALYGQLTEKSDVYSFGIVILETITGRKVLDTSNSSTPLITDLVWDLVKTGNVEAVFDESIREGGPKGIMERFVHVGILCAHVMVAFRPTIAQALKMLEGDIDIPKLPQRPLPLSHESFRSSLWHSTSTSTIYTR